MLRLAFATEAAFANEVHPGHFRYNNRMHPIKVAIVRYVLAMLIR